MEKRISESELVLPSLYLMCLNKGRISTTELIERLTHLMKPQGKDAEILENRKDTYFSQKVRNLKSHDTLERDGFATYDDGEFVITNRGLELVKQNEESIKYLFSTDFEYVDIRSHMGDLYEKRGQIIIPYSEVITEGEETFVVTKSLQRSKRLRNAAISHFTHDGVISCDCCGFVFESFYGKKYGVSCIEIHHIKPIFEYEGQGVEQTIENAIENLLPVCPNCHRVIHRYHITKMQLPDFKKQIQQTHF